MFPAQQRFPIAEPGDTGAARRGAMRLAADGGADETAAGAAALVATELATNILKHAGRGEILLRLIDAGEQAEVEVLAIDAGAGMDNVGRCMADGYSTAGSPGTGLGAVRRLSASFDVYSEPGRGTVAAARIRCRPGPAARCLFETGSICLPVQGETECGDACQLAEEPGRLAAIVVDGLGHGSPAAEAAGEALAAFGEQPFEAPGELLQRVHRRMTRTRGGAVALVQAGTGAAEGELYYAAVGNISGSLIHNGESRGLFTHNGIVGGQMRTVRQLSYPRQPASLLVLHSDGLKGRWQLPAYPGLAQRHPAVIAGVLYRDFHRSSDDVTVLVTAFHA